MLFYRAKARKERQHSSYSAGSPAGTGSTDMVTKAHFVLLLLAVVLCWKAEGVRTAGGRTSIALLH